MGQQHGGIALFDFKGDEQQHEADGSHDLRVHHREIVDLIHHVPDDFFRLTEADGRNGSHDRGNQGRDDCHRKGGIQSLHHFPGFQHVLIPAQRKAGEGGQGFSVIEGENHHIQDRKIEEGNRQNHQDLPKGTLSFFHRITLPPFRRGCVSPLYAPPSS